ncbi:hypothetical protein MLD38_001855 [Melastoma candidum]|uniref:Uncharacterized protein n=1 Tax=Melastoma candidum TaxID=119954 RepID=A0ACB9SEG5_9MYRT|nr:hypothetical protein MLD38_001855 [Melastoma candidum]
MVYDFEGDMAAGTDLSRPFVLLEGGYNREEVSRNEEDVGLGSLDGTVQFSNAKPPRHLSTMQTHCVGPAKPDSVRIFFRQFVLLVK